MPFHYWQPPSSQSETVIWIVIVLLFELLIVIEVVVVFATAILLRLIPGVRFELCASHLPDILSSSRPNQLTDKLPDPTMLKEIIAPLAAVS